VKLKVNMEMVDRDAVMVLEIVIDNDEFLGYVRSTSSAVTFTEFERCRASSSFSCTRTGR